jgi:SnoaL-like domain
MATTATQQGVMTDEARIRELLLLNLFGVFSERDRERRMEAIVANYTEDVVWSAPEGTTHGHEELNEGAQKLLDRTPDFVFTAAGPVHVLCDLGYLPSTMECRSSRPRPAVTTWRSYAMDGSPCCTRC